MITVLWFCKDTVQCQDYRLSHLSSITALNNLKMTEVANQIKKVAL